MIQQKSSLRNGSGSVVCIQSEQAHLGDPPTQPGCALLRIQPCQQQPDRGLSAANTSGKALNDNYFRPLAGVGAITYNDLSGNSSYNSLQVVRAARDDAAPVLWPGLHLVQDDDRLRWISDDRQPLLHGQVPQLWSVVSAYAARAGRQLHLRTPEPRPEVERQAAGLGDRPLVRSPELRNGAAISASAFRASPSPAPPPPIPK